MNFLDLRPLLTLSFWFKLTGDPLLPVLYYGFIVFFGLLVLASLVCAVIYNKEKGNYVLRFGAKYLKNWFLSSGLTGFLFLFFNYERAIFLSSRFWYLVWFLAYGLWLFFILKKIKKLPEKETSLRKQAQFDKYLPRTKSHK